MKTMKHSIHRFLWITSSVAVLIAATPIWLEAQTGYDAGLFNSLTYRNVGPYRGGRSTAVTGIEDRPNTFYMGTTGGGVWLTNDNGISWNNISDGSFSVGSIGSIDVAATDRNVIYVGTGTGDTRGNTSTGRGIYKSVDGGDTWAFSGLADGGQIGRIEIHPRNPDIAFAAVLGHPFGKNETRGVYRTTDGGETWERVLYANDSTGASVVAIDPENPRNIYAGLWRAERKPWAMISGGADGGVYRSRDGGDTWEKLSGGLPEGIVGKVGLTVSPANPDRIWVIIEAEPDGGVYRSDDGGDNWERVNSENKLRQRAWYYTHVRADPTDPNTVYALNTGLYRSVDAGKTFEPIQVPHGDVHDLWINPGDPSRMIVADDGGAQVTVNSGETWSTYFNQPTAELYGVVVDNGFPYRLYGAQQDNTTITVPAWMSSNTLYPKQYWYSVGGCETGPIALHPDVPDVVYAGCYGGVIDRFDRRTDQVRNVVVYPQLQLGEAGKNLRYRFQWVSPIVVSPHDPNVVYHGSQYVLRSTDGGMSWETLSPDLTTNNPEHQDFSGGPINHDITGVEIYNTIFSIAVSPHAPDEIWAGTDDGRVHVSRDNGVTWNDVTPRNMPALGTVDAIDISAHQAGTVFIAVHNYRMDDFAPYIFRTDNFGESWRLLTDGRNGIPADFPTRVVREDPERQNLLFVGTEFGIFVSFDGGGQWQSIQQNLPVTPVTDLRIAHDDVVISTQGRSFWILDDMTPLRQMTAATANEAQVLFQPRPAYRANMEGGGGLSELMPESIPGKALFTYYFGGEPSTAVTLEVVDAEGRIVQTYSSDSAASAEWRTSKLETSPGAHRVTWDLKYPGPRPPEGTVLWGYSGGVKAPPGTYTVRLTVNGTVETQEFQVLADPRLTDVSDADYLEQFRVSIAVRDSLNEVYQALENTRALSENIAQAVGRAENVGVGEEVRPLADSITINLGEVEEDLTQTKNQSGQDPIRFAPMLDNQFVGLYEYITADDNYRFGGAEGRPTPGAYELFGDLNGKWNDVNRRLLRIISEDIARLNELLESLGVPAVPSGQPRPIS